MLRARIAIVGGGLSGLYAAALLQARGIQDYVLLEARSAFGGRLMSASPGSGAGRFDLGATWFWPDLQPDLLRLVQELGLVSFAQPERGGTLLEYASGQPPSRVDGPDTATPALRLAGGMTALTDALRARLDASRLRVGHAVTHLRRLEGEIEVLASDGHGATTRHRVAQVLLALPPRLAAHGIDFSPPLPPALLQSWRACATWMAPHAKYLAVYDAPFWRTQGLCGAARSAVGPMVEIHDASAHGSDSGALFGFLGVPARVRHRMAEGELQARCRAQLVRLFGPQAAAPRAEYLKDWAGDPHTAVAADQEPGDHHMLQLDSTPATGAWQGRLIGIASEWSPAFSGYVAGALDAAQRGVDRLLAPAPPVPH